MPSSSLISWKVFPSSRRATTRSLVRMGYRTAEHCGWGDRNRTCDTGVKARRLTSWRHPSTGFYLLNYTPSRWLGRWDSNPRPPGSEPGATRQLSYSPTPQGRWWALWESNPDAEATTFEIAAYANSAKSPYVGVDSGARTRGLQIGNLMLYHLSYAHSGAGRGGRTLGRQLGRLLLYH